MEYPKKFIEKVKRSIPDYRELHEALDSGSVNVGHCFLWKSREINDLMYEWAMIYKKTL